MTTIQADIGDVVRVQNVGDAPFVIAYDGRNYKLEPQKDVFMPFEAAVLWFGDPRSTNTIQSVRNEKGTVAFIPDRETEVRRLRVKYGNIGGDERFVQVHPDVEVYDVEGNRIKTVLDDPEGEEINVATPTVADQNNLVQLVERQQRQIEFLLGKMGLSPSATETPTETEDDDDNDDDDGFDLTNEENGNGQDGQDQPPLDE